MSLIWIVNILSVFFLCVFFAGIVIPQILLIAFRRRLFDEPDERKIHQCVVPRLGGMAFKPVVFFSFVLLLAVNVSTGHDELLKEIGAEALPLAYAFCAIIMLYLVGIADDLIGVRYRAKFFIQIVCGIMLVAGGVELSDLHGMLFMCLPCCAVSGHGWNDIRVRFPFSFPPFPVFFSLSLRSVSPKNCKVCILHSGRPCVFVGYAKYCIIIFLPVQPIRSCIQQRNSLQ